MGTKGTEASSACSKGAFPSPKVPSNSVILLVMAECEGGTLPLSYAPRDRIQVSGHGLQRRPASLQPAARSLPGSSGERIRVRAGLSTVE
jgi:hypothetical protein